VSAAVDPIKAYTDVDDGVFLLFQPSDGNEEKAKSLLSVARLAYLERLHKDAGKSHYLGMEQTKGAFDSFEAKGNTYYYTTWRVPVDISSEILCLTKEMKFFSTFPELTKDITSRMG